MKNIYEILKDFGLEIPAEKKTDFEKAWKENYRTKSEYDNAVTKRDEYKSSLDTVSEQLKAFDGVDVADLNGQIKKLQDDLKAKDDEYAGLNKIQTNVVALAASIVITPIAVVILCMYFGIVITWQYVFASILAAFVVYLVSTGGWEKVSKMWDRSKYNKKNQL